MDNRIAQFCVKKYKALFIFAIALTLFTTAGLQSLIFDADIRTNFGSDDPQRIAFERLENEYGRNDGAYIAVEAKEGDLFTKENLIALEELTTISWQVPYSTRVNSFTNFQYSYSQDEDLVVDPLVQDAASLTPDEITRIRHIALHEPSLVNRLITPNGKVASINITMTFPPEGHLSGIESSDYVEQMAKEFESRHPQLDLKLSGNTIASTVGLKIMFTDLKTTIPVMYLLMFGSLLFFIRSVTAVVAVYVITMTTTLSSLGIAGWLGMTLNSFSITAANVIITITIAHCVHLLSLFFQNYQNCSKTEAMIYSIRVNWKPIVFTSLTTIIGFLGMNLSDLPATRTLGNVTAIGVAMACLYSFILLPSLLLLLPVRKSTKGFMDFNKPMSSLAKFVTNNRLEVGVMTFLIAISFSLFAQKNAINENYVDFIDDSHQFTKDNRFVDHHFGALYGIEFSINSGEEGGIADPTYLANLAKLTDYLRTIPEIRNVYSYSDIIKRVNKNFNSDDPQFYKVPSDRELAAQYLMLYEMSLPYGHDLGQLINSDKSATHLLATFPSTDTYNVNRLQKQINDWMKANMPEVMYHDGSSYALMISHAATTAMSKSIEGALLAFLIITLTLMFALKSFKFGLLSIIPNALPAAVGFGAWALYSGEMGINLCGVLGVTIGIVVDDTVHFLSKYLRARNEDKLSPEDAIAHTFQTVGPALCITTSMLVVGFGSLVLSDLTANSDWGALTALIIGVALILDMLLLPAIILLVDRNRRGIIHRITTPSMASRSPVAISTETTEPNALDDAREGLDSKAA